MSNEMCHELTPRGATPISSHEVLRRLKETFAEVEPDYNLGRIRQEFHQQQLLDELQSQHAPHAVIEEWQRRQQASLWNVLQVTVLDGDPLRPLLDLTITPQAIRVYHDRADLPAVERCAQALDCQWWPLNLTGPDERASANEIEYRARCQTTRQRVEQFRDRFEGQQAIFQSETKAARVRIDQLRLLPLRIAARVTCLPTPGLANSLKLSGIHWRWWEFSCNSNGWYRGPHLIERLWFGEAVAAVVQWGSHQTDAEFTRAQNREVTRLIQTLLDRNDG